MNEQKMASVLWKILKRVKRDFPELKDSRLEFDQQKRTIYIQHTYGRMFEVKVNGSDVILAPKGPLNDWQNEV